MAVTIDRFEMLPSQATQSPGGGAGGAGPAAQAGAGGAPPLDRHEVLRALRLEHSRLVRVRAD